MMGKEATSLKLLSSSFKALSNYPSSDTQNIPGNTSCVQWQLIWWTRKYKYMKLYMLKQLSVMYVSSVRNHQFTVQIILFLCYLLCISTSLWIFLMFRDLKIDQRSSELLSENEKANKTKHTTGTQTGMIETWHIAHYLFVSQFQGENTTYSSPWSSVGVYPTQFSESYC